MGDTFSLGRVAGIRIGLHWSVLVLMAIILWTLAVNWFPDASPDLSDETHFAMAVVASILFFASILAHELGHALQARRDGMGIDGITLWALGGVARFTGNFPGAGAEFRIAVAGPLVSAVLAGGFLGLAALPGAPEVVAGVAFWLGIINLLLLAFNLIPALPLDGGRILRAALWAWRGNMVGATRIAGGLGRGFAYLLMGGGVLMIFFTGALNGIWLVVLGWFLSSAASAETQAVTATDGLESITVRDVMVEQPVTASPMESLARLHEATVWGPQFTAYPVVDRGVAVGLLPARCFNEVPQAMWASTTVESCMVPLSGVDTFSAESPALDAMWALRNGPLGRGLVVDENQRMLGMVSVTDISRLMRMRQAFADPVG